MPHTSNPAMRPMLMVLALLSSMFLSCGGSSDAELIEEAKKLGEKIGKRAGRRARRDKKARREKRARKSKKSKSARSTQTRLKLERADDALRFARASIAPYDNGSEPTNLGAFARGSADANYSVRANCEAEGKRRVQWDCIVAHEWMDPNTGGIGSGCYLSFTVRDSDGQTTVGDMNCAG